MTITIEIPEPLTQYQLIKINSCIDNCIAYIDVQLPKDIHPMINITMNKVAE